MILVIHELVVYRVYKFVPTLLQVLSLFVWDGVDQHSVRLLRCCCASRVAFAMVIAHPHG